MLRYYLSDMTTEDAAFLTDVPGLEQMLYMYDPSLRSARRPEKGEVPWPIVFALCRFSAKHRFVRGLPDLSQVSHAVSQAINRLHWRTHFHFCPEELVEGETDVGVDPALLHVRKTTSPPCRSDLVPHELRVWTDKLHDSILTHCKNIVKRENID